MECELEWFFFNEFPHNACLFAPLKLISLTITDRQYNIEGFFTYFKPGLGFVHPGTRFVYGNYANMKPHIWTTFRAPEPFVDYIELTEKVPWNRVFEYNGWMAYQWNFFLSEELGAQLYLHFPKAGKPKKLTWLRGSYYMERYPRNWSYQRPSKK